MTAPRISVVIPVFDGAALLPAAIASVRAQDYPNLEIIVVDDASRDGSGDVAASLGADITVLRLAANVGAAAARNRGLAYAGGEAIAFLDADDCWPDGRLRLMVDRLQAAPPVDIVAGRIHVTGALASPRLRPEVAEDPHAYALVFGCTLIRRSVFDRVGPLDPAFRIGHDTDWFLRAREAGIAVAVLDADVLDYRIHGAGLTQDSGTAQAELATALKRSLDRRRAGGSAALSNWHRKS